MQSWARGAWFGVDSWDSHVLCRTWGVMIIPGVPKPLRGDFMAWLLKQGLSLLPLSCLHLCYQQQVGKKQN